MDRNGSPKMTGCGSKAGVKRPSWVWVRPYESFETRIFLPTTVVNKQDYSSDTAKLRIPEAATAD